MKYAVRHTFGNFIHEGSKAECELVMKAFTTYGIGEFKFEIVEIPTPKLSDNTRSAIQDLLVQSLVHVMFGDGMEEDYVRYGMGFKGVDSLSDSELLEELASVGYEDHELYIKGMAELAVEAMLTEE